MQGYEEKTQISASFFPETIYCYRVRSSGFMRNQVRLMMGRLLDLGKGNATLEDIKNSLDKASHSQLRTIVTASGLSLNKIEFDAFQ